MTIATFVDMVLVDERSDDVVSTVQQLNDPKWNQLDVVRWRKLAELVDSGEAYLVLLGKVDTVHSGLEITSAGEMIDEIDKIIHHCIRAE